MSPYELQFSTLTPKQPSQKSRSKLSLWSQMRWPSSALALHNGSALCRFTAIPISHQRIPKLNLVVVQEMYNMLLKASFFQKNLFLTAILSGTYKEELKIKKKSNGFLFTIIPAPSLLMLTSCTHKRLGKSTICIINGIVRVTSWHSVLWKMVLNFKVVLLYYSSLPFPF